MVGLLVWGLLALPRVLTLAGDDAGERAGTVARSPGNQAVVEALSPTCQQVLNIAYGVQTGPGRLDLCLPSRNSPVHHHPHHLLAILYANTLPSTKRNPLASVHHSTRVWSIARLE